MMLRQEDFTNALRDISGSSCEDEDSCDNSDGGDHAAGRGSESASERQARLTLVNPAPEASAQELRKALGMAQMAFAETRTKLLDLTKRYNTLVTEMETQRSKKGRQHNAKAPSSIEQSIVDTAKKYCLLYHLWVPQSLFPVNLKPQQLADIDPLDPSRWQTSEGQTVAEQAELYRILPLELHKSLRTFPEFSRVFSKAMTEERANIIKNVKDVSTELFSDLGVRSTLFSGEKSLKADDPILLALMKRPGDMQYTQFPPVLFTNPTQVRANDLFKSNVLVKIARVLMFGKAAVLSSKKRGGPKGRGERMGIQSVTEGLIACTATFARYLLSHDPEFTAKGEATGIPYHSDYELYLKLLLQSDKRRWALEVINFFNVGIFGLKPQDASQSANDSTRTSQVRSWEDNLLSEIGDDEYFRSAESPSQSLSVISNPEPHLSSTVPANTGTLNYSPAVIPPFHNPLSTSRPSSAAMPQVVIPQVAMPQIAMPQVSAVPQNHAAIPQFAMPQAIAPVNPHVTSETSFNGLVAIQTNDLRDADLQAGVSQLSITSSGSLHLGPSALQPGHSHSISKTASGRSKLKAKAVPAYPAQTEGSRLPDAPQIQVQQRTGRITRSRKRA